VAKFDSRVYAYRFDWDRGPEPWKTVYGAAHAVDLPFIFGNFGTGFFAMDFSARTQPGREALSGVMMQSIGAFLRSGDPNVPALGLRWQPWRAGGTQQKLVLNASDCLCTEDRVCRTAQPEEPRVDEGSGGLPRQLAH